MKSGGVAALVACLVACGCAYGTGVGPSPFGQAKVTVVRKPGYQVLADVNHRNEAADVDHYEVTLLEEIGATYVEMDAVPPVELDADASPAETTFTQLAPGKYRVSVVAFGDADGTDELTTDPVTADFDLSAGAVATPVIEVDLDDVALDMSATGAITEPTVDGVFDPPASGVALED